MNEILERVKDMKSTLPGTLVLLGSIVVIFKEAVAEVVQWIAGLGLYLIFGAGGKKLSTRVILKDKE